MNQLIGWSFCPLRRQLCEDIGEDKLNGNLQPVITGEMKEPNCEDEKGKKISMLEESNPAISLQFSSLFYFSGFDLHLTMKYEIAAQFCHFFCLCFLEVMKLDNGLYYDNASFISMLGLEEGKWGESRCR